MVIDYVKINIKSGDGGNGAMSFRREKYVANGGPDGGDGGKGGNVYLKVDKNTSTLLAFKYKKIFEADNGRKGEASRRAGKSGKDLYIPVPMGTIVKDIDKNVVVADMSEDGQTFLIAKGGRGGRGNQHFATPTRQVPNFSESGHKGVIKKLELELKMLADVGLIGFPNVGKSTLISTVSSAKPKIANYHFTTLEPALGVVKTKAGDAFVMADIPGIIEGASDGLGLGIKFLKHVERTRLLLHVIDVSGIENTVPVENFKKINEELKKYSEKLAKKKQIVVASKIDSLENEELLKDLEKLCKKEKLKLIKISSVTHEGIEELIDTIAKELKKIPKEDIIMIDENYEIEEAADQRWYAKQVSEGYFAVTGAPIERLMSKVNIFDIESRQYMQRILNNLGVMNELRKSGLKKGDTIDIIGFQMEYLD
jgi:GTP-binding protein